MLHSKNVKAGQIAQNRDNTKQYTIKRVLLQIPCTQYYVVAVDSKG